MRLSGPFLAPCSAHQLKQEEAIPPRKCTARQASPGLLFPNTTLRALLAWHVNSRMERDDTLGLAITGPLGGLQGRFQCYPPSETQNHARCTSRWSSGGPPPKMSSQPSQGLLAFCRRCSTFGMRPASQGKPKTAGCCAIGGESLPQCEGPLLGLYQQQTGPVLWKPWAMLRLVHVKARHVTL